MKPGCGNGALVSMPLMQLSDKAYMYKKYTGKKEIQPGKLVNYFFCK